VSKRNAIALDTIDAKRGGIEQQVNDIDRSAN